MRNEYKPNVNSIELFWRAANYLCVGILYLKSNPFLDEELKMHHFKKKILGHWGTCPGINAIYAHTSDLVRRTGQKITFITGTGHAGTALLSCMFLEGILEKYYPEITRNKDGAEHLFKMYSESEGFSTEISASYPGVIYTGGELGAALAFTQGYVMNNPESFAVCVIGDGELETSITQATWQGFRFLSKEVDGKILPVINANGYKMGSSSIYSLISKNDYECILKGYGLIPIFANVNHAKTAESFNLAYRYLENNSKIQPIIVFETPKGWTAPKAFNSLKFEGSSNAHKPIIKNPFNSIDELVMIKEWLLSYEPKKLFDESGRPFNEVLKCLPTFDKMLGLSHVQQKKKIYSIAKYDLENHSTESTINIISNELMKRMLLDEIFIFSPDELKSNRFGQLLNISKLKYSTENNEYSNNGKIIEILNEHLCFTWAQGYTIAGNQSIIISYEAFAPIFDSLVKQYLKYLKACETLIWRRKNPFPSINIILTSLGWNNTPSHHNPCFIDNFIGMNYSNVRIYAPVIPENALNYLRKMLNSKNKVNIMFFNKYQLDKLVSVKLINNRLCKTWLELDSNKSGTLKVTLIVIGDCMAEEALAAKEIINNTYPNYKLKVIAVEDLSLLENHNHSDWEALKLILEDSIKCIWIYNGYPKTIKNILWELKIIEKTVILGFIGNDQSKSGIDRFKVNKASRYDIVEEILKIL